jgi:DDB1- and CUL4-associated factor 17
MSVSLFAIVSDMILCSGNCVWFQPIQAVTYEDDFDLLVVTQIQQSVDDDNYTASVHLHDNQTGKLVKTIDLIEKWDTVGLPCCL